MQSSTQSSKLSGMIKRYQDLQTLLQATLEIPVGQETGKAIFKEGKEPVIQFNIKPFFHLNTIHFALLQIISRCLEEKFRCSIVLCDKWTVYSGISNEVKTQTDAMEAMDYFFEILNKYNLNLNKIEVIPESVLWNMRAFRESFLEDIINLSYIAEKNHQLPNMDYRSPVYYFNVLLGLLYEGILKPDFILTSGREVKTIWKDVRSRNNLEKVFGKDYVAPVMVVPDTIFKYNSTSILGTQDTDDPFCESFDETLIVDSNFSQDYIGIVNKLNSIKPITISAKASDVIKEFRRIVYSK